MNKWLLIHKLIVINQLCTINHKDIKNIFKFNVIGVEYRTCISFTFQANKIIRQQHKKYNSLFI